jgi:transposase-like protein
MTDTKTPIIEHFEQARSGHRRRFTTEQKQALLADAALPGGSISATARLTCCRNFSGLET